MTPVILRTRYSAIRSELPKPSPSLSAPEYIPTINTGELDRRPVSLSNLDGGVSCNTFFQLVTHLDTGRSRPNLATVSMRATFGSRNRMSARISTMRLRNKEWANLRANVTDFCW